jgi:hypothetical protein
MRSSSYDKKDKNANSNAQISKVLIEKKGDTQNLQIIRKVKSSKNITKFEWSEHHKVEIVGKQEKLTLEQEESI